MEPTVLGEKRTLTVHVAPGARLDPHVVVFGNSPLTAILLMVSVLVVLVFFTVTVWAALVVPTPCTPKTSAGGVRVTVWAVASFGPGEHTDKARASERTSLRIIGSPGGGLVEKPESFAVRAVDAAAKSMDSTVGRSHRGFAN
jgi:hypothetical protein